MSKDHHPRLPDLSKVATTAEIAIPSDPMLRVIGQDEAVGLARISARQRRHLLLVGPPGTGKSMIAQALSLHLPRPTEEIRVVHNPENPERPLIEVKKEEEVRREYTSREFASGDLIDPKNAATAAPIHPSRRGIAPSARSRRSGMAARRATRSGI